MQITLYPAYIAGVPALLYAYRNKIIQASVGNNFACIYQFLKVFDSVVTALAVCNLLAIF